jgi:hypothetical protein
MFKGSKIRNNKVAFLWDESFLWGLMAYKALIKCNLPFDLVRSADIKDGALGHYAMLFVPGGWASNKSRALGPDGITAIRSFIESGGSYLGFCGGAGLATRAKGGIGLLDIQRKPTRDRVPSFSGRIYLNVNQHPIWEGLTGGPGAGGQGPPIFNAWWPSQFVVQEDTVKSLASFGHALPDAFSSDLNVGDVAESGNWDEFEKQYQINLNPERLSGEPAVIEGLYGNGKVILSLVHFDTPEDNNGEEVLIQLWKYLSGGTEGGGGQGAGNRGQGLGGRETDEIGMKGNSLQDVFALCADLITLGERNFLWFWRNSMLLQWRRGVRGLEYNTLYVMVKEISEIMNSGNDRDGSRYTPVLHSIHNRLHDFVEKAEKLLVLERHALQKGPITYIQCDDPEIQTLRKDLFGEAKSHGGMFKETLDEMDGLLYTLLTDE